MESYVTFTTHVQSSLLHVHLFLLEYKLLLGV